MHQNRLGINKAFELTGVYYPPGSTNILYSKMEITLTDTKKETLKAYCSELLHKNNQIIRYIAKVIGLMTSSLPRVKYGAARYRYLEQAKRNALKLSKEWFDAMMILSP